MPVNSSSQTNHSKVVPQYDIRGDRSLANSLVRTVPDVIAARISKSVRAESDREQCGHDVFILHRYGALFAGDRR